MARTGHEPELSEGEASDADERRAREDLRALALDHAAEHLHHAQSGTWRLTGWRVLRACRSMRKCACVRACASARSRVCGVHEAQLPRKCAQRKARGSWWSAISAADYACSSILSEG
eukprot:3516298-Pleurochrysis_carterae.AAC.1